MAEDTKRLTTEEIWATALAVVGGLAVLVPILVFSLIGRDGADDGLRGESGVVAEVAGEVRAVDLPVPETADELRKELRSARERIDSLGGDLAGAKSEAATNLRSAERAWKQIKASGGFEESVEEVEEGGE